jgi:hypothetical protein
VDAAIGLDVNQDVAGLDVLVQNADRVGGRDRISNAGDDLQPRRQRDAVQPAERVCPVSEIAVRGILSFEKVWRIVEPDVVQPHNVGPVAQ